MLDFNARIKYVVGKAPAISHPCQATTLNMIRRVKYPYWQEPYPSMSWSFLYPPTISDSTTEAAAFSIGRLVNLLRFADEYDFYINTYLWRNVTAIPDACNAISECAKKFNAEIAKKINGHVDQYIGILTEPVQGRVEDPAEVSEFLVDIANLQNVGQLIERTPLRFASRGAGEWSWEGRHVLLFIKNAFLSTKWYGDYLSGLNFDEQLRPNGIAALIDVGPADSKLLAPGVFLPSSDSVSTAPSTSPTTSTSSAGIATSELPPSNPFALQTHYPPAVAPIPTWHGSLLGYDRKLLPNTHQGIVRSRKDLFDRFRASVSESTLPEIAAPPASVEQFVANLFHGSDSILQLPSPLDDVEINMESRTVSMGTKTQNFQIGDTFGAILMFAKAFPNGLPNDQITGKRLAEVQGLDGTNLSNKADPGEIRTIVNAARRQLKKLGLTISEGKSDQPRKLEILADT